MRRRPLLVTSGIALGGALGWHPTPTVANQDEVTDTSGDRTEPEPLEFEGEGVTVTDEFEIEGGPTVVEGIHDGESTFLVRAVPRENGLPHQFISHTGNFQGAAGTFAEEGTYVMYVDADGSWELVIRQPHVSEDEADEPPVSIAGNGADWVGPLLFDGTTLVAGKHAGEGAFRLDIVPQEGDGNEFVFNAVGTFGGITSVHTEGIGYINVIADGQWAIELE